MSSYAPKALASAQSVSDLLICVHKIKGNPMSSKISILAGSGLTALAMLSTASAVEAHATHKHACTAAEEHNHKCVRVKYVWVPVSAHHGKRHGHAAAAAPMVTSPADVAEMADLRNRVEQLTARLEASEAANRATADQAAAASAQTAALGTQMAATKAAVAGQVKSAINAGMPKANWSADTKVTGTVFFNASNINQQKISTAGVASKTVPSGTGLDIKRVYVGVDHNFSKTWSASILLDASAQGTTVSSNANLAGTNIYVKNAFVQAKVSDALIARVGVAGLPWFGFAEGVYGERYIENTVVDRLKIGSSADYGVHVLGTLGNPKGLNVTYAASVVNGAGYKNPTRTNSVDVEGRVAANYKGFVAAVGGYSGKLAADAQGDTFTNGLLSPRTATREDALLGYVGSRFRVGGEWFWAKNFTQALVLGGPAPLAAGGATQDVATGWSLFSTVYVTPKWSVFGRYDRTQPSQYISPNRREDYFNLGVTYSPVKIVDLSLVYKRNKLNNNAVTYAGQLGTLGTQNGTIGASGSAAGTYDEVGLFGQVKF